MTLKFKLLTPHKPDCTAVASVKRGSWTTPWAFLETLQKRDSVGRLRSRGYRRWWHVRCNDTDCPATIAVDETSILEGLPRG